MKQCPVSTRRRFLQAITIAPFATSLAHPERTFSRIGGPQIKVSCNAYSFNKLLRSGAMPLIEMIEFCAGLPFDGVDLTGYYFAGYPAPPSHQELVAVKRRTFLLGLDISGTGVRNNFSHPDESIRRQDEDLVNEWLKVASRLGAPSLRVFAGRALPHGTSETSAHRWVVDSLRRCARKAAEVGVMLALQNHAEFIKIPEQLIALIEEVDSDWLGAMLDIGSFRSDDPYEEIARAAPYAISWQIKEQVYFRDRKTEVDLDQIRQILHQIDYRGYVLVETLEGDPRERVPPFLDRVREKLI